MHVALARKYRPHKFADLIGQEHVARALQGAVQQGRVAHGYLLCGPRGVGKTTAARILAMALNCETRHAGTNDTGEPCGVCASCERIWAGSASLDVVEIDAASNRGVDDARELRERAMYAASQEGRHKIYIVDEAHMLTREAWNTLLKVLEEPPPGVVFVFATTEPHKITNTAAPVMSRLQRFDFRRVGPEAIAKRLAQVAKDEGVAIEPDAVQVVARLADGGMRDALSVLDQVTAFGGGAITATRVREVLGLVGDEIFAELLDIVAGRRADAVFPLVAKLVENGVDLVTFAEGAGELWRGALAIKLGATPDGISVALQDVVKARIGDLEAGDLLRMLRCLEESEEIIRRGNSPRLTIELLLVRWAMMDRTIDIAALLNDRRPETGDRRPNAGDRRPETGDRTPERAVVSAPAPAPERPRPAEPAAALSPTVSGLRSSVSVNWPSVLDQLRADRKMVVAETLTETRVCGMEGDVLELEPQNEHASATIERYRAAIESAASKVLGSPVKIRMTSEERIPETGDRRPNPAPQPSGPPENAPLPEAPPVSGTRSPVSEKKAERLSVSGARAERAKSMRGKDPALDSAIEALDLELLD
jgi:DNA polymerase-3 subunit gamma/tau